MVPSSSHASPPGQKTQQKSTAPAPSASRRAAAPLCDPPAATTDPSGLDGMSMGDAHNPFDAMPASVASCTAPRRRYARSKVGWASKERSTPEGYNREEHAWRFESPFPQGMSTSSIMDAYEEAFPAPVVIHPPKKKKSPEERQAIREKKTWQSERASLCHVETALLKYNRVHNTMFLLDEITVFFEFGGPCYHYNFTANPENNHPADGCTKLFFSEINCPLQSEDDVLLCCIGGDKDAGHCHSCEDYRPMMVHPSSRAYGGGNTTAIDYPEFLMRTAQAQIVTISMSW